jgi:hypothetical protein
MLHSQARDGLIFGSRYVRGMAQTAGHQLFQRVLPECNVAPASYCCAFSDVACRGSFGPMRRKRPVRGEPAMDQQTQLSGRKRGCRPLERAVVGDL